VALWLALQYTVSATGTKDFFRWLYLRHPSSIPIMRSLTANILSCVSIAWAGTCSR